MASVNSRAELFPNRAFTPTGSDDMMMDDDPEFQVKMPFSPRHQSSYENMNGKVFMDNSHEYEDPSKLKDEVFRSINNRGRPLPESIKSGNKKKPRRKANEVYEPVQTKERRRTFTNESEFPDDYPKDRCPTLFKILAFAGCLLGLAALAVIIMLMLGILPTPGCHECKKEIVPEDSTSQASGSTQELWQMVEELKANVTDLSFSVKKKDEVIEQLQKRDLEHTNKIAELEKIASYPVIVSNKSQINTSGLVGPRGPPGIPGPACPKGEDGLDGKPGKPGSGNMSLCRYMSGESVHFTADSSGNGQNVIVAEPKGFKIVGVTCSTRGTSEYNLKSELNDLTKVRQYECECRGRSLVFAAGSGHSTCIIHYWMCPLIS